MNPDLDDLPVSDRTRVHRLADRHVKRRAVLHALLDDAPLAHVVTVHDGQPVAIPFACARDGDSLLLHGSTGAGTMLAVEAGRPISVSITLLDGMVVARSLFDNSMNYRSAVIFGVPEILDGDAKLEALTWITDRYLPGRSAEVRPPNRRELAATRILRLPLEEASVKLRSGPPSDEDEDSRIWAGVVPLRLVADPPVTRTDVPAGTPVPGSVQAMIRRYERAEPMAFRGLVKSLAVPDGFTPPRELSYGDVHARALSRADLTEDVRGVNRSLDLIQRTRGGDWPTEPVTEDGDYVDLVWHEFEFREGSSYAYAVYHTDGHYLGCCYLYPMGQRTPLTRELLDRDVDVSWWVTPEAHADGYYGKLYVALQHWISASFPFGSPHYSNVEIPEL